MIFYQKNVFASFVEILKGGWGVGKVFKLFKFNLFFKKLLKNYHFKYFCSYLIYDFYVIGNI